MRVKTTGCRYILPFFSNMFSFARRVLCGRSFYLGLAFRLLSDRICSIYTFFLGNLRRDSLTVFLFFTDIWTVDYVIGHLPPFPPESVFCDNLFSYPFPSVLLSCLLDRNSSFIFFVEVSKAQILNLVCESLEGNSVYPPLILTSSRALTPCSLFPKLVFLDAEA